MKGFSKVVVCVLVLTLVALSAGMLLAEEAGKNAPQYIYACACGKGCDCGMVATKPGKCKCGKEMGKYHVLKIEGDKAVVCGCGGGCTCALDDSDPTLCSCGTPVKDINLKGLYVCPCGSSCPCNTVSDQPGTCSCGKELKKVE